MRFRQSNWTWCWANSVRVMECNANVDTCASVAPLNCLLIIASRQKQFFIIFYLLYVYGRLCSFLLCFFWLEEHWKMTSSNRHWVGSQHEIRIFTNTLRTIVAYLRVDAYHHFRIKFCKCVNVFSFHSFPSPIITMRATDLNQRLIKMHFEETKT